MCVSIDKLYLQSVCLKSYKKSLIFRILLLKILSKENCKEFLIHISKIIFVLHVIFNIFHSYEKKVQNLFLRIPEIDILTLYISNKSSLDKAFNKIGKQ